MAEIKVPAWPIPIHHTKFVMAHPQPTGMRMQEDHVGRTAQGNIREHATRLGVDREQYAGIAGAQ